MELENQSKYAVAVVGAGPAGLYAARQLAMNDVRVALLNRDIKPGGLAEYGIYPTKYKMKNGLRKQFFQILENPAIDYFGNTVVAESGDLSLTELQRLGFQAIVVAVGAQGTKWLGLPGEDTPKGVYHAKDIVYYYNDLPPFSQQQYHIGQRVAIIGVGNVMLDIARWLIRTIKVDEVIAVARRGPAEVKFAKKEMEAVIANLDLSALDAEIEGARPLMESLGQDPQAAKDFILAAQAKAEESVSDTRFRFDFLASPTRILNNGSDQVRGLEIEETTLLPRNGDTKAKGTSVKRVLDVDTVIFCIGDRVDDTFGLPVQWNEFVKNENPRFPIEGVSYEAYDYVNEKPLDNIFMVGWSREASHGLVGVARKDGERGALATLGYLSTQPTLSNPDNVIIKLAKHLEKTNKRIISKDDIEKLKQIEENEARENHLEAFKFSSNEEMLDVLG
jgi:ferredoxin--NADP+ reductase